MSSPERIEGSSYSAEILEIVTETESYDRAHTKHKEGFVLIRPPYNDSGLCDLVFREFGLQTGKVVASNEEATMIAYSAFSDEDMINLDYAVETLVLYLDKLSK